MGDDGGVILESNGNSRHGPVVKGTFGVELVRA
jgi:hypothetical protein